MQRQTNRQAGRQVDLINKKKDYLHISGSSCNLPQGKMPLTTSMFSC